MQLVTNVELNCVTVLQHIGAGSLSCWTNISATYSDVFSRYSCRNNIENLNDFSITQLLSNLIGGGPPHSGAGHSYLSRDSALVRRVRYTCDSCRQCYASRALESLVATK